VSALEVLRISKKKRSGVVVEGRGGASSSEASRTSNALPAIVMLREFRTSFLLPGLGSRDRANTPARERDGKELGAQSRPSIFHRNEVAVGKRRTKVAVQKTNHIASEKNAQARVSLTRIAEFPLRSGPALNAPIGNA